MAESRGGGEGTGYDELEGVGPGLRRRGVPRDPRLHSEVGHAVEVLLSPSCRLGGRGDQAVGTWVAREQGNRDFPALFISEVVG